MNICALVPIKKNSDRVKNKNFKNFNNKPLFHWIIKTLDSSKYISKIIVNSDSEIIKNNVHKLSKKVVFNARIKKLIGDKVSMNKIIDYDIKSYEADFYLQTHVTNPILSVQTINKSINFFLKQKKFDSLFSVTEKNIRLWDEKLKPVNHNPHSLIRTQDLKNLYEENSCIYIFSKKSFNLKKNRIGSYPTMFKINKLEAIDIDDAYDFKFAEQIHKLFI